MTILILVALALAAVAGFWYSYYQSLKKLRAHDRETVRLMEHDLAQLERSGASPETVAAFRARIDQFRTKHNVRPEAS
jgi:flagellar basal body-associated protein FliL